MSSSGVTPLLRYRDPNAAAQWLCRAFSFKVQSIEQEPDGSLRCIVLDTGQSMVVVGPASGTDFDPLMVQPSEIGGGSTQTCYLSVNDVAAHCATAQAAGASIEYQSAVGDGSDAYYLCRDPEGHLWSFGTHSFSPEIEALPAPVPIRRAQRARSVSRHVGALLGVGALLVGGSLIVYASTDFGSPPDQRNADTMRTQANNLRTQAFAALQVESRTERKKRIAAEKAAEEASVRHTEAVQAGEALKAALSEARSALQVLRQQNTEIEQNLQATENAAQESVRESKAELQEAQSRIASLDQARTAALEHAEIAAKKLQDAEELNRVLHQKLEKAASTIRSIRLRNRDLDATLVEVKASYDKKIEQTQRQLKFASAEFSKVTRQLTEERKQSRAAVVALARTAEKLDAARSTASELSQRVTWLETELKDSYANFRMRFGTLQLQDNELALAALPPRIVKEPSITVKKAKPQRTTKKQTEKAKAKTKKQADKTKKKVAQAKKPKPTTEPDTPKLATACARAVWPIVGSGRSNASRMAIIKRLCASAQSSVAPARCFQAVMGGQVNWGSGTRWAVSNAINLCAGSKSASSTLSCFKASVPTSGWRQAVQQCRSG